MLPVGEVVAIVDMSGEEENGEAADTQVVSTEKETEAAVESTQEATTPVMKEEPSRILSNRFYSPLVRKIAKEEGITNEELESIEGSGANGRVQKKDILNYIENRKKPAAKPVQASALRLRRPRGRLLRRLPPKPVMR